MTKVAEFVNRISDSELRAAILELKELDESAVLPDGAVRRLSVELAAFAEISTLDARKVLDVALIRRAAYQWVLA